MAKKSGENSNAHSKNGFNDVIGIVLILFIALPLLIAQFSFDINDIAFHTTSFNKHAHNWIGPLGAHLAHWFFLLVGQGAYLLPWISGAFGLSYLFGIPHFLRERVRWFLLWSVLLLISVTGIFHLLDINHYAGHASERIGASHAGGGLGWLTYDYGFWMMGTIGAAIVYAALGLIALLFLTNFHLSTWIRLLMRKENFTPVEGKKSPDELALEKRAQELEKQKRQLEEEVGKSGKFPERAADKLPEKVSSGLGADGLPVPEPTVRDLSVPQQKGPRVRKTTFPEPPKEIAPATDGLEVGEVIHAEEIPAATADEILGRKSADKKSVEETKLEPALAEAVVAEKSETEKSAEPKREAPAAETSKETSKPASPAGDKHANNGEVKPRFDFYKILPGTEEAVTDKEFKRAAPAATKEVYFLQVAAFRSPSDADNLKARLALAGIEAQIQTATLPDGQVWHRVRVGPFSNQDELSKSRAALKENKLEANLIKVRE